MSRRIQRLIRAGSGMVSGPFRSFGWRILMRLWGVSSIVVVGLAAATSGLVAQSGAPAALSKAEAQKVIDTRTHIGICANADPTVFTSVLTAPAIQYKPPYGSQETRWLYPVKASYTVHCTQGNRNMHYGEVTEWQVEVQADYRLYKDPYGELQVADNFDSDWSWDDQHWDNAHADVRCRAKRLAFDSYDPAGKLTKRREDTSPGYGDCNVRMVVAK